MSILGEGWVDRSSPRAPVVHITFYWQYSAMLCRFLILRNAWLNLLMLRFWQRKKYYFFNYGLFSLGIKHTTTNIDAQSLLQHTKFNCACNITCNWKKRLSFLGFDVFKVFFCFMFHFFFFFFFFLIIKYLFK